LLDVGELPEQAEKRATHGDDDDDHVGGGPEDEAEDREDLR
jgi:hypothetical protein